MTARYGGRESEIGAQPLDTGLGRTMGRFSGDPSDRRDRRRDRPSERPSDRWGDQPGGEPPTQPDAKATTARLPIIKKIAPGQPGSRRWFERFGDALVCVRYRVDAEAGRRLVTVELQVDAAPLRPRNDDQAVLVRIEWRETELRELARQHGARWDSTARAWRTTRAIARKLRWVDRIVTVAE